MSADPDEDGARVRASMVLQADLGAFLFAEVGVEPGGMPVTVLSALARLGLDPWDEAGRLAKQPHQEAASQLAHILAAKPGTPQADTDGVAARLVALLPGRTAPPWSPPAGGAVAGVQAAQRRAAMLAVAGVFMGLALLLAGHLATASGRNASGKPPDAISGQP